MYDRPCIPLGMFSIGKTDGLKLKTMLESRRVYREDAAGERSYLGEAERAEARSKAEELIKETCGN